jgi:hypothetical protein
VSRFSPDSTENRTGILYLDLTHWTFLGLGDYQAQINQKSKRKVALKLTCQGSSMGRARINVHGCPLQVDITTNSNGRTVVSIML